MTSELDRIHALRQIRVRREERLSRLRENHVRQCARIEQEMLDAGARAQQATSSIRQGTQERWKDMYSHVFDSVKIMRTYHADNEGVKQIAHIEAGLDELKDSLMHARARLTQVAAEHVQCMRRLEACSELLVWHGRQKERRAAAREDAEAEALQGARRGC